jgi:hypothetical protein
MKEPYYKRNKDTILKKKKVFYKKNKKRLLKEMAVYRNRNKDNINKKRRVPNYRYSEAKSLASRYHVWDITKEDYICLIVQGCYYCENSLLNETGIGLDRIRNDKDYTTDNVVPCCGTCNRIRSNVFTTQEMLELGKCIKRIRDERD